jgi:hypothetical protein
MREIGSVADDLDVGAILEGRFMHIAPHRDAHFGEAGAVRESPVPNLRHRWGDGNVRKFISSLEHLVLFVFALLLL